MDTGIYFHIPFCQTRCNYCHFVTRPWQAATAERYARAVVTEMRRFFCQHEFCGIVDTMYFGGGTPSLVPTRQIQNLIDTSRDILSISDSCEISLEANPGSLTAEQAADYTRMGINRISVGAQSFDDGQLASIGRDHTGSDVDESCHLLRRQGITNLNLDLMLGLPGQDESSWHRDLERLSRLEPYHASIYMLDLDEKSPLFHDIARGRSKVPDDDLVSDLYLLTLDYLEAQGYEQYEISNFARPGFECRHNLKYWQCAPVLGFGVGSHSFDGRCRYANNAKIAGYLNAVEAGGDPIEWTRPYEKHRALQEKLFLGLRMNQGIDWSRLRREHDSESLVPFERVLAKHAADGLLQWNGSVVRLTRKGLLLSNEVFLEFI